VFGTALAGLMLGHTISYLIAVPDPHQRQFVLERTGHGYMPELTQVVLMVLVAAVASIVARAFRHQEGGAETFPSLARTLGAVQATAFVGQEILERLVAHAPLHTLGHDRLLLTGVLVQVVVAVVAARLLLWISGASARLAAVESFRSALPRPACIAVAMAEACAPRPRTVIAKRVRAPPAD
jgi:hypothetical protein